MKIVVLNECFLSKEQLGVLSKDNDVSCFDITSNIEDAKQRIQDAEIIFVDQFVCPLSNDVLNVARNLKLIVLNTTAYHLLDLEYLRNRGVSVCNTPDFCSTSVAELVFFYTLTLSRNILTAYKDNSVAPFEILPDELSHRKYVGFNLEGKTIGILGMGNIGQKVSQIAQGFEMNVLGYNRSVKEVPGVKQVELKEIFSQSDIVVVTLPYDVSLEALIDDEILNLAKNHLVIVNISSHEILSEEVLIKKLKSGELGGYGLDNFTNKDKTHYFYNTDKVVILPHLGFFSSESLSMIGVRMMEGYDGFIKDKKANRIV